MIFIIVWFVSCVAIWNIYHRLAGVDNSDMPEFFFGELLITAFIAMIVAFIIYRFWYAGIVLVIVFVYALCKDKKQ